MSYNCDECSSEFFESSELKYHVHLHEKDKPFTCEICSKRFSQKK